MLGLPGASAQSLDFGLKGSPASPQTPASCVAPAGNLFKDVGCSWIPCGGRSSGLKVGL